jgi:hypothetical protein
MQWRRVLFSSRSLSSHDSDILARELTGCNEPSRSMQETVIRCLVCITERSEACHYSRQYPPRLFSSTPTIGQPQSATELMQILYRSASLLRWPPIPNVCNPRGHDISAQSGRSARELGTRTGKERAHFKAFIYLDNATYCSVNVSTSNSDTMAQTI